MRKAEEMRELANKEGAPEFEKILSKIRVSASRGNLALKDVVILNQSTIPMLENEGFVVQRQDSTSTFYTISW